MFRRGLVMGVDSSPFKTTAFLSLQHGKTLDMRVETSVLGQPAATRGFVRSSSTNCLSASAGYSFGLNDCSRRNISSLFRRRGEGKEEKAAHQDTPTRTRMMPKVRRALRERKERLLRRQERDHGPPETLANSSEELPPKDSTDTRCGTFKRASDFWEEKRKGGTPRAVMATRAKLKNLLARRQLLRKSERPSTEGGGRTSVSNKGKLIGNKLRAAVKKAVPRRKDTSSTGDTRGAQKARKKLFSRLRLKRKQPRQTSTMVGDSSATSQPQQQNPAEGSSNATTATGTPTAETVSRIPRKNPRESLMKLQQRVFRRRNPSNAIPDTTGTESGTTRQLFRLPLGFAARGTNGTLLTATKQRRQLNVLLRVTSLPSVWAIPTPRIPTTALARWKAKKTKPSEKQQKLIATTATGATGMAGESKEVPADPAELPPAGSGMCGEQCVHTVRHNHQSAATQVASSCGATAIRLSALHPLLTKVYHSRWVRLIFFRMALVPAETSTTMKLKTVVVYGGYGLVAGYVFYKYVMTLAQAINFAVALILCALVFLPRSVTAFLFRFVGRSLLGVASLLSFAEVTYSQRFWLATAKRANYLPSPVRASVLRRAKNYQPGSSSSASASAGWNSFVYWGGLCGLGLCVTAGWKLCGRPWCVEKGLLPVSMLSEEELLRERRAVREQRVNTGSDSCET